MPAPRLVLFPGLGLDERIYLPQRRLPVRVEVPAWPEVREGESLADYARRWARTIEPGDDLYLGGMSMGGPLALEAGRILRPRGIFLIGSAFSGRAIAGYVRATLGAASALSEAATRRILALAPLLLRVVGRPDRRQRLLLLALARDVNLAVVRWGARALIEWQFDGPLPAPVHQIHGRLDLLVPVDHVRPDAVVPEGGHAINVTHAGIVNRFILDGINAIQRGPEPVADSYALRNDSAARVKSFSC